VKDRLAQLKKGSTFAPAFQKTNNVLLINRKANVMQKSKNYFQK